MIEKGATAGPNRECSPMAPPPNTPNHLQEERDPERSDTTSARRWVRTMRGVRHGLACSR